MLTSSIDAGIKWRPNPSEVAELGPEFQKYWDSYFANAPDKPVLWVGISSSCVLQQSMLLIALITYSRFVGDYTVVPQRKYYSMGLYTVSHLPSSPPYLTRNTPDSAARRNTHSHMDTCTSPTPTTLLRTQTSSLATSSRSSPFSSLSRPI
jgi:hypothetical protein